MRAKKNSGEKAKSLANLVSGDKQDIVKSVSRAINILVSLSNGTSGVTGIAAECGLSNSTAHRLLQALVESDAVIEDPTSHQYYLGHLLSRLISNPLITHEHLIRCADREMKHLASETGETVSLITLIGLRQLRVRSIPSSYSLRVVDIAEEDRQIGDVYVGAPSKLLLSQLPEDRLRRTLEFLKLDSESEAEARIQDIGAQVKKVKQQGYAVTRGERVRGGMCISVPIVNYSLPVSLNIYGPDVRLKPQIDNYLDKALQCAERISGNIRKVS